MVARAGWVRPIRPCVLLMIANKHERRVQHYLQTASLIFITISLLPCGYVPSWHNSSGFWGFTPVLMQPPWWCWLLLRELWVFWLKPQMCLQAPWSVNSLCFFSIFQVYYRTLGYVLLMIANKHETRVQHYLQTASLIFITISHRHFGFFMILLTFSFSTRQAPSFDTYIKGVVKKMVVRHLGKPPFWSFYYVHFLNIIF